MNNTEKKNIINEIKNLGDMLQNKNKQIQGKIAFYFGIYKRYKI